MPMPDPTWTFDDFVWAGFVLAVFIYILSPDGRTGPRHRPLRKTRDWDDP